MSIGTQLVQQGLMDYYGDKNSLPLSCALPYGGTRDVAGVGGGAKFAQGQAIGVISVVAANEVRTLTLSGASGTVTLTWTFQSGVYQASFAYNATTAQVLAAVVAQLPGWGNGNLAVTGTPGSSYVFTFGGTMGNAAVGGGWAAQVTAGTATWATTQKGSSTCQYDIYNSSLNNDVDGVLAFDVRTDYTGARIGAGGFGVATNTPTSSTFYGEGTFLATDLVGIDANALTLKKVFSKAGGTLIRII